MEKPRRINISTPLKEVKNLFLYAKSKLPTQYGLFTCYVFREAQGTEHVALVHGEVQAQKKDVLCRIHSECLTGEVFCSLKCDCKQQLESALKVISSASCGVLLYLRQEGRGIGLGDKIRAYDLQDQGLDTVDANTALGLPVDRRDYSLAPLILAELGVVSVCLLTDNPLKLQALRSAGIQVKRKKLILKKVSKQAEKYVRIKQVRLGHLL